MNSTATNQLVWQGWSAATIATWDYVPQALVCLESFLAHHPGAEAHLVLAETREAVPALERAGLRVSFAPSLGIPRFGDLAFKYSPLELSTALKPFVLDQLLAGAGVRAAVYLDSDVLVLAPFDDARQQLERDDVLLTPHLLQPMPRDGLWPAEIDFLRCGSFNAGFVGVRKGEASGRFLPWWKERLEEHCFVDWEPGVFMDQKWMDLAHVLFPGVAPLRHRGYNVAYWNLQERGAIRADSGRWRVGATPLVLFHFSGLDRANPEGVSRHQNRHRLASLGQDAASLFEEYVGRVERAESAAAGMTKRPYSFGAFSNGVRIAEAVRRLYRSLGDRRFDLGDPFDAERKGGFYDWMTAAAGRLEAPLPPIARFVYERRPKIARLFPDPEVADRLGFLNWMLETGGPDAGLDPRCLDTTRRLAALEEERIARVEAERVRAAEEDRRRQEEERERALAAERKRVEDGHRRKEQAALEEMEARFSGVPHSGWKRGVAKAVGFERYRRFRKAFWVAKGILREKKAPPRSSS